MLLAPPAVFVLIVQVGPTYHDSLLSSDRKSKEHAFEAAKSFVKMMDQHSRDEHGTRNLKFSMPPSIGKVPQRTIVAVVDHLLGRRWSRCSKSNQVLVQWGKLPSHKAHD